MTDTTARHSNTMTKCFSCIATDRCKDPGYTLDQYLAELPTCTDIACSGCTLLPYHQSHASRSTLLHTGLKMRRHFQRRLSLFRMPTGRTAVTPTMGEVEARQRAKNYQRFDVNGLNIIRFNELYAIGDRQTLTTASEQMTLAHIRILASDAAHMSYLRGYLGHFNYISIEQLQAIMCLWPLEQWSTWFQEVVEAHLPMMGVWAREYYRHMTQPDNPVYQPTV